MKKKEKDNRKLASKVKNSAAGNGHQTGSASRGGEFDPRGVRKMDAQARPLGSLPAGIKQRPAHSRTLSTVYRRRFFFTFF